MLMRRPKEMGNTLSEYGFIAALIAVVALGGTLLLGQNLAGIVKGLTADQSKHASAPEAVTVAGVMFTGSAPSGMDDAIQQQVGRTGYITLRDGTQITLTNVPDNMQQAVQTTGGNGTTMMLSNTLEDLTGQLLNAGKITQDQADALYKIAKQGHKMADIEGAVESATSKCSSSSCFNMQSVTWNGTTYADPAKLANLIGYKPNFGNGPELKNLYDLLDSAQMSGALSDPAVNKVVSDLTHQIGNIADSLESATGPVADGSSPPGSLLKIAASYTTNETADTICTMRGKSGKCK